MPCQLRHPQQRPKHQSKTPYHDFKKLQNVAQYPVRTFVVPFSADFRSKIWEKNYKKKPRKYKGGELLGTKKTYSSLCRAPHAVKYLTWRIDSCLWWSVQCGGCQGQSCEPRGVEDEKSAKTGQCRLCRHCAAPHASTKRSQHCTQDSCVTYRGCAARGEARCACCVVLVCANPKKQATLN